MQIAADLVGLTRDRLRDTLALADVPAPQRNMRSAQLWRWLYNRGATTFDQMTDVSKDLRATFANVFAIHRPDIAAEQVSSDGTRKWLLRLAPDAQGNRQEIETVYIPEEDRGTLCISSQVGCTLTCSFCHTGTQRLVRNLSAGEIVGQVLIARDRLNDWPDRQASTGERAITNVVLMGMGEPLYNFENVRDAVAVISDGDGLGLSSGESRCRPRALSPKSCGREMKLARCWQSRCMAPPMR